MFSDYIRFYCLLILFLPFTLPHASYAQEKEKATSLDEFSGSLDITHAGISFIPSFSLGAPALILNAKMAKKRFSFEPDMRFALEGKPWIFLFWFRHKTIKGKRFNLRLGMHPALSFRAVQSTVAGVKREVMEGRRYLAAEILPSYKLSQRLSVGMYYLYSHGFDFGVKKIHLLATSLVLRKLPLTKTIAMTFVPQIYYLQLDKNDGFYTAAFTTITKKNFPFGIKSIVNYKLQSAIVSDNFLWNISLLYFFQ